MTKKSDPRPASHGGDVTPQKAKFGLDPSVLAFVQALARWRARDDLRKRQDQTE